jgi:tetratricopeptide (TPR) repeat protein
MRIERPTVSMKETREEGEARELDELFERYRRAPTSYVFVPLADACRKMGRIDEALEICENGVRRHPEYPSGHVVRGKCLYDKGQRGAAREAFSQVLRLDEDNLVALKYLGNIEADEGNLGGAQRHFRRILTLDPDNKEIRTILGMVDEQERSADIDEDPQDDILERVSEILRAGPVTDEAELSPEKPAGDEALESRSSPQEAALEAAGTEPETSDELASVTLAEIFASQGYASKAEKIYREVLRRQPGNEDIRRRLSDLTAGAARESDNGTPAPRADNVSPLSDPPPGADASSHHDTVEPVVDHPTNTLERPDTGAGADAASEAVAGTRSPDEDEPSPGRPEIDEQDSLGHFRRWLTRVQK